MKAPKGYRFKQYVEYDDYVEFHFENSIGDTKIYIESRK